MDKITSSNLFECSPEKLESSSKRDYYCLKGKHFESEIDSNKNLKEYSLRKSEQNKKANCFKNIKLNFQEKENLLDRKSNSKGYDVNNIKYMKIASCEIIEFVESNSNLSKKKVNNISNSKIEIILRLSSMQFEESCREIFDSSLIMVNKSLKNKISEIKTKAEQEIKNEEKMQENISLNKINIENKETKVCNHFYGELFQNKSDFQI